MQSSTTLQRNDFYRAEKCCRPITCRAVVRILWPSTLPTPATKPIITKLALPGRYVETPWSIRCGPGGERILDIVPGGTELGT